MALERTVEEVGKVVGGDVRAERDESGDHGEDPHVGQCGFCVGVSEGVEVVEMSNVESPLALALYLSRRGWTKSTNVRHDLHEVMGTSLAA